MPIHEYECQSCGYKVENFERKPEDKLMAYCPECGNTSLRKIISAGSFNLKGKGFYKPGHSTGKT